MQLYSLKDTAYKHVTDVILIRLKSVYLNFNIRKNRTFYHLLVYAREKGYSGFPH